MTDATRKAIAFADEIIAEQLPLWEQAAAELGIDVNAAPVPGSPEEVIDAMSTEEFLGRTPRSHL